MHPFKPHPQESRQEVASLTMILTPSLDRSSLLTMSGLWQPPPPCLDSGPPCLVSVKLYPDMQCTRLNHTHRSLGRRLSPSPCLVSIKLYPDMQYTRFNHTHRSLGSRPTIPGEEAASPTMSGLWTTMSGKRQTLP